MGHIISYNGPNSKTKDPQIFGTKKHSESPAKPPRSAQVLMMRSAPRTALQRGRCHQLPERCSQAIGDGICMKHGSIIYIYNIH